MSTFVYRWTNESFGTELNHTLLSVLYCRFQRAAFAVATRHSPVFHRHGWRDFFEPFCPEAESWVLHVLDGRPVPRAGPTTLIRRAFRRVLTDVIQPVFYPDLATMATTWEALRALRHQDQRSLRGALTPIAREVWRFNTETERTIAVTMRRLALPARYAALHIRRGDKDTEVPHTSEMRYVERLERATPLQDVYVATDDYRCVEKIQRLRPSWRVSSLCPPAMHGYYPDDFNRQPAAERGRRTLLLLTELEIMRGAEVFVGTFSSGVGTFLGLIRDGQTYGVDSEEWVFEGGV